MNKKSTLLMVIAITLLVFASCRKSKVEDGAKYEQAVKGKWYLKKQALKQYRNGTIYLDTTYTTFTVYNYMEFNDGGNGVISSGAGNSYKATFKYNLLFDKLTVTQRSSSTEMTYITPYTISSVSDTEMKLTYDYDYRDKNSTLFRDVSEEFYTK
jgi:hypothetical protein